MKIIIVPAVYPSFPYVKPVSKIILEVPKWPKVAASICRGVEINHLGSFKDGYKTYQ